MLQLGYTEIDKEGEALKLDPHLRKNSQPKLGGVVLDTAASKPSDTAGSQRA